MFRLSDLPVPLVQAPMAGGPSTVELAEAVSGAGALPFLAAGYRTPEALAEQIAALRARTAAPFGVNVFVPGPVADPGGAVAYRDALAGEAAVHGVELPEPDPDDTDHFDAKLRLLAREPVPVVSFTFGPPPEEAVRDLHAAGTSVVSTVTSAGEAATAVARGADALCVQGPGAGGHRGTFDPAADSAGPELPELLAAVRAVTDLPLIAAGGIATGAHIAAALDGGAAAVQLGTAYLRTPEAGTHPTHRAALADPRFAETVVTRAFSGRPARGLRNRFTDAHGATAPAAYPLVHQITGPLRRAAAARGDADSLHLWAGVHHRQATDLPAGELTERLWWDARQARRGAVDPGGR